MESLKVGIIGCGAISGAYLSMARHFPGIEIVAAADLNPAAAQARAREFHIPRVASVEQLLADASVDLVLNLTIPTAHAPVSLAAIDAGKHVFSEKPLGISREEGRRILDAARQRGVRIGCAPDTFLGAGLQTARELIDHGSIGRPVAFTAFMMNHGHESWHPNPEFYYQPGGGPMFDMGPYYLTALLNLLGPIRRLSGMAAIAVPDRTITSRPLAGRKIDVRVPDHVAGTIEFENGAIGSLVQTFAVWHPDYDQKHPIVIYGTEGTLKVPDPNQFDGAVLLRGEKDNAWREEWGPFAKGYGRAVGLAEMAHAIQSDRPHRANDELAFAVLDAMQGFFDSSASGQAYAPAGTFIRPSPLRANGRFGDFGT